MSMKQDISQKQKQTQVMKPAMIKSLEMLQKPILELREFLREAIIDNPMLELEENEDEPQTNEEENSGELNKEEPTEEKKENEDEEINNTLKEAEELSEILDYWNEEYSGSGGKAVSVEKADAEKYVKYNEDYKQKINVQIDTNPNLSESEKDFAYDMIESIDSYGFLPDDYDIFEECKYFGLTKEQAQKVHNIVLNLEPKGLTARNIKECLLVQLDRNIKEYDYIKKIIEDYFEDLIHRRYKKIASAMGVTQDMILSWKKIISKLDPKPGLRIMNAEKDYVYPEVVLKKIGEKYEILINDFNFPKIKISRTYSRMLQNSKKGKKIDKESLNYVKERLNSAKFIIKSIYLRNRTLKNVVKEIIEFQKDFFYEKSKTLKPMKYADIADRIGVNESTISRVVRRKYIDTPFGILSLKTFFTGAAGKDDNYNSISAQNVKSKIKGFIEKEDKSNPLTDSQLTEKLKQEGLNVSRRVVAKYRKQLGFLNSHLRKK